MRIDEQNVMRSITTINCVTEELRIRTAALSELSKSLSAESIDSTGVDRRIADIESWNDQLAEASALLAHALSLQEAFNRADEVLRIRKNADLRATQHAGAPQ